MKKALAFTLIVVLAALIYPVYAKVKFLQYIPRDENLATLTKTGLDFNVAEVPCDIAADLQKELVECQTCVALQGSCPDCCLVIDGEDRSVACSEEEDPQYDCEPFAFNTQNCMQQLRSCSDIINYECTEVIACQRRGCPDPEPDTGHSPFVFCNPDGSGGWLCNKQNLNPKFTGCTPTSESGLESCKNIHPYYIVQPVPCPPPDEMNFCYKYEVSQNFSDCIEACRNYADETETCRRKINCCKDSTCLPDGYQDTCTADCTVPGGTSKTCCQIRVEHPECDEYTLDQCMDIQKNLSVCQGVGSSGGNVDAGKCLLCFKEIEDHGEPVSYSFIAKSRERLVISWQILASHARATSDPDFDITFAHLHSMVKIWGETEKKFVHQSMVVQKSFGGSFNIFAATSVDKAVDFKGEEYFVLQPGCKYTIKPYYFIPPLDKGLEIRIDSVQMTVLRIRD
ncbi:MAG: hypothetical protein JW788_00740 [Candidatus Omnitrophica bacterium]|nr:hypothetical protein [Candidatus Omnitrophota bacterium]